MEQIRAHLAEVERLVADPEIHKDQQRAAETMREHTRLARIVQVWDTVTALEREIEENRELAETEPDKDLRSMAEEELNTLVPRLEEEQKKLKMLLIPADPLDGKNTIVEIRAGTGGDEASLFAADLYRMYMRYAESMGWKTELIESNETEVGGFKEVIVSVTGQEVYSHLKYESGVHRVQRVPATESSGRIHTSAVTVAVLPEADETDITIRSEDLKIDVFRSSGPGGQSVNTTDSAVRITHLPTGLVVTCQDEKSQHKNKAKALRVLKARLFEQEERRRRDDESATRKNQIGSGDRSERIRTYNFPQNRLTDHRINLTLYHLDAVVSGDLAEVVDTLRLSDGEDAASGGGADG